MINLIPFEHGLIDGKKWIRGHVPLGKDRWVYVDTQKSIGADEICKALSKFITYQALKINFPSFSHEDIKQELLAIIIEAIPSYDINKNSNMLTFLQNHTKNRIINMCKYFSESRRRATHMDHVQIKARCPECKNVIKTEKSKTYQCPKCHYVGGKDWKVYNTPVLAIPFSSIKPTSNNRNIQDQDILDFISESELIGTILGEEVVNIEKNTEFRLDFLKFYETLSSSDRQVLDMLLTGNGYKEMAAALNLSDKAIYVRLNKIATKFRKMQG